MLENRLLIDFNTKQKDGVSAGCAKKELTEMKDDLDCQCTLQKHVRKIDGLNVKTITLLHRLIQAF